MKLKEKRRCQWKNYISKQQKVFKPFMDWNWNKCTSSLIEDMRCCGFWGFTKLHLQGTHFSVVPNTFGIVGATTYGCSNIIMSTYTTISDGCMCMYAMHVLNSMNNHNESNLLYFKAWII